MGFVSKEMNVPLLYKEINFLTYRNVAGVSWKALFYKIGFYSNRTLGIQIGNHKVLLKIKVNLKDT